MQSLFTRLKTAGQSLLKGIIVAGKATVSFFRTLFNEKLPSFGSALARIWKAFAGAVAGAFRFTRNLSVMIFKGGRKVISFLSPRWLTLPKPVMYFTAMFLFSFLVIALESIEFHVLQIVTDYLKANLIISIAMLGIALGSLIGFYLIKLPSRLVLLLSAAGLFYSVILSYYNIINIAVLQSPIFLILPFIFASIIISVIFAYGNSNFIYFTNLIASGLGVLFPIFMLPLFKSETSMMYLMLIPLIFSLVLSLSVRNIIVKLAMAAGAVFLILGFYGKIHDNISPVTEIPAAVMDEKIMPDFGAPELTGYYSNIAMSFLKAHYSRDEESGDYVFSGDEYDFRRAGNFLRVMEFLPRWGISSIPFMENRTVLKDWAVIPGDVFDYEIIPHAKAWYGTMMERNYDTAFMNAVFTLDEDTGVYRFSGTEDDLKRVRYLLTQTGHMETIDLAFDVRPHELFRDVYLKYFYDKGTRMLLSEDNSLGRLDYQGSYGAPGEHTLADHFSMGVNGALLDHVDTYDGSRLDVRVPHIENANIFVVGLSADGIVKSAKRVPGKDTRVSGVELLPATFRTMSEGQFAEFAHMPYEGLTAIEGEGRSYLKNTDELFDMITLMNIHMEHGPVSTFSPESFHTVEGTKLLLNRLTDQGIVDYEEIILRERDQVFFLKFLNTIKEALREMGYEDPSRHIHIYLWDFWGGTAFRTISLSREPFTDEQVALLDNWVVRLQNHLDPNGNPWYDNVTLMYSPSRQLDNDYDRVIRAENDITSWEQLPTALSNDEFFKGILDRVQNESDRVFISSIFAKSATGKFYLNLARLSPAQHYRLTKILDQINYPYKWDLRPATDDKPFPYDVFKGKRELWDYWLLIFALSMLLVIPVLLLILNRQGEYRIGLGLPVLFTSAIGFGYMLIEIALMQKFQLYIGAPMYSMIVILGGILLFSGIGSFVSRFFKPLAKLISMLLIPVVLLIMNANLDAWFVRFSGIPLNGRLWVSAVLIFPLSFLMGIPFPTIVSAVKKHTGNEFGTLLFGVSGAFSTIAVVSSMLTSTYFGFSTTFRIGMACYGAAALIYIAVHLLVRHQERIEEAEQEPILDGDRQTGLIPAPSAEDVLGAEAQSDSGNKDDEIPEPVDV